MLDRTSPPIEIPRQKDRFHGVQVLRFLAAGLVLVTHSTFYAHERLTPDVPVWSAGEVGVDIFFVISGFVMYLAAGGKRDMQPDWVVFALRRMFRIFPMYWLATLLNIAVLLVIPAAVLHSSLDIGTIVKSILLVPDINSSGRIEPIVGPGWTLYLETLFYSFVTVALLLRLPPVLFSSIALGCFAACVVFIPPHPAPWFIYFNPVLMEFVAGMLIAKWLRGEGNLILSFVLMALGMVGCLTLHALFPDALKVFTRGIPAAILVSGVVMLEAHFDWSRFKSLVLLGEASYVLYLFHPSIAPVIPMLMKRGGFLYPMVSVVLSCVVAVAVTLAMYILLDRPIMRVLSEFAKSVERRRLVLRTKSQLKAVPQSGEL